MAQNNRDVLPTSIKPKHYSISLFDLSVSSPWSYSGIVKTTVDVQEAVNAITVNVLDIKLLSAKIAGQLSSSTSYDLHNQRATLHFDHEIKRMQDAELTIEFSGIMNDKMCGFYRSKYKSSTPASPSTPKEGEYDIQLATQFESCDARRAFPCWDEPNLKATFDFEIEIPEGLIALSNMPEKATHPAKRGRKVVSFERTPLMSTYLLAWAVGDFEYVEDFTRRTYRGKNLPVRVYTTRGLKEQGRFALEHAHQVVDLFSEVFRIDYPLPKVDLIAVHEFAMGAMENWGLITYRTTAVLFDEKTSDAKYRNRVAYVVAHELAHQWFGNLCTMNWWSSLWLNEAFATWVGWYAIDRLHMDWQIWEQFVAEGLQTAFTLDSIRSSHPIEVPVRNALDIDQIFDAISYLKGSSVLRMLANHLGQDVFLKGVGDYLKAHEYSNAEPDALWSALSNASGEDVDTFMKAWIGKVGHPVLTVAEEPGQIGVQQRRFLSTGDVEPEDDSTLWWIPLNLKSSNATASSNTTALTTKEQTIRDIDESFYKLNADTAGFYRVNYPPDRLIKLGQARSKLSTMDSIGLIGDAAALAVSGDASTTALLSLCAEYKDESNYLIWQQLLNSIGNVRSIFGTNEDINAGLRKFVLDLVGPAVETVGWSFPPNEGLLEGQLRALLITSAGGAGHQPTISKANELFAAYTSGNKDVMQPSLRLPVFRLAIEQGGKEAFEAVKNEYLTTTSVDGQEVCLIAMGRVQTIELAKEYLDFMFTDQVKIQDIHTPAIALAMNTKTRNALWTYVKDNWQTVYAKLSSNKVVLDRFLKNSLNKFADQKIGADIDHFFRDKDTQGYEKGVAQTLDTIKGNAAYKERDEAKVLEWLKAKHYS